MTSLLLNCPYWLLVLLAIFAVVVFVSGMRRGRSNLRTAGLAMMAAAALLLILRLTVVTDEKRIERQTRAMIEAVARNDWNAAAPYLRHARLYAIQGDDLVAHAKERAKQYQLTDVRISSLDLDRQPNVFVVRLAVTSYHKGQDIESVPSAWSLEYQRRPEGWVLTNLVPISIGIGNMVRPEDVIGRP